MSKHTVLLVVTLCMLFPLLGCGPNVSMSGKVVYSDDKTPLTTGVVCFESDTHAARGKLNENGEYKLGSKTDKDGLPPGNYRVYISGAFNQEVPPTARSEETAMPGSKPFDAQAAQGAMTIIKPLIAVKYGSGTTSGITVDVKSSTRTFDFEVERHK